MRRERFKAGVFAGVDPRGPAYAVGLRNGMLRLARVDGGRDGDSRVAVAYRVVAADGVERVMRWLPGRQRACQRAGRDADAERPVRLPGPRRMRAALRGRLMPLPRSRR